MPLDNYRLELNDLKRFRNLKLPEKKMELLLKYATLAPSTHNTQPWLFKIEKNYIDIFTNSEKKLPKADPTGRDLYISIGCCLENLLTAAKFYKVYSSHKIYSGKGKGPMVRVFLSGLDRNKEPVKSERYLMKSLVERMNVRGLFLGKNINKKDIGYFRRLNKNSNLKVSVVTDKEKIKKLSDLTAKGLVEAHSDPDFRREMFRWMNSSLVRRQEGIPTYSLRVPFILSVFFPYLIRNFNMGSKLSKLNYMSMKSSSAVCIISAKKEGKKSWVEVGQLAQKMMLEFNAKNINTSIFLAATEIGELYKGVMKILDSKLRPQFLFCSGYMKVRQKYTERIPATDKLI